MITRNFKYYGWVINRLRMPIADVEGHAMGLTVSGLLLEFEDGDVASATTVSTGDMIKNAGSFSQYVTSLLSQG